MQLLIVSVVFASAMDNEQSESLAPANHLSDILRSLVDYYSDKQNADPKNIYEDKKIFPNFRSGPLEEYRQKASFCYKRMNVLLEGEEHIRLKVKYSHMKFNN